MWCCWCGVRWRLCCCASRGDVAAQASTRCCQGHRVNWQAQQRFPFSLSFKVDTLCYHIRLFFLITAILIISVCFETLHIGKHNFKKYCVTLNLNKQISGQILSNSKYLLRISSSECTQQHCRSSALHSVGDQLPLSQTYFWHSFNTSSYSNRRMWCIIFFIYHCFLDFLQRNLHF